MRFGVERRWLDRVVGRWRVDCQVEVEGVVVIVVVVRSGMVVDRRPCASHARAAAGAFAVVSLTHFCFVLSLKKRRGAR